MSNKFDIFENVYKSLGMKNIFENNYRFGVETFLMMYLNNYQLILGADLEYYSNNQDLFDEDNPCNIYFVLRRPKVTVDPNSIKIDKKTARFNLLLHVKDDISVVNLSCEFLKAKSKIEHFTQYPYNILAFRDKEKALMITRPSSLIDSNLVLNNILPEELDYEILYIGQAYGKDGKRTALDRLSSHETVQKIYAHTSNQHPDSDIWFMLANFSQQSMLVAKGSALNKEDKKVEDKKIEHVFENNGLLISDKQRINFTEAALIKYFQPKYNIEFKDSFPTLKHKSYSECYNLDIKGLMIELDTSEMIRKIYTRKTGRKQYHQKMFEFNSDKDRISLLEAFE